MEIEIVHNEMVILKNQFVSKINYEFPVEIFDLFFFKDIQIKQKNPNRV
jgi:hypothetical protein